MFLQNETNSFRVFVILKTLLAIIQSLMIPTKNSKMSSARCGMDDNIPLFSIETPKISFKYFGRYVSVT